MGEDKESIEVDARDKLSVFAVLSGGIKNK
jgi:hypothetical protein